MSRAHVRPVRWSGAVAAAALIVASVAAGAVPAKAETPPQSVADTAVLTNGSLAVTVSTKFPQVLSYDLTGASAGHMDGNATPITHVTINGTAYGASVTASPVKKGTDEDYQLAVDGLDVAIDASISVANNNTVTFKVTKIQDPKKVVDTLSIPDQHFVSVSSDDPKAQLAETWVGGGDTYIDLTATTAIDPSPVDSAYAIVSNSTVSASLTSNATANEPMMYQSLNNCPGDVNESPKADNQKLEHQVVDNGTGGRTLTVSSAPWLYRVTDSNGKVVATNDLPWTKIAVEGDVNGDGAITWQDGAIGLRQIDAAPYGASSIPDTVVYRIPFNIASEATNPFLKTLDDTKLVNEATDGLGQLALLKGYQGEGQDTDHPDYGNDFNQRAGGLTDFNTMLDEGKKLNATYGVHINESEAYPEAKSFTPDMLAVSGGQICQRYSWLDSGYYIDQFKDIASGSFADRIKQLADNTHDNLSMVYVDTYFTEGWLANSVVNTLNANGFSVATEDSSNLATGAILGHGAIQDGSGNSSQILRFVHNSDMDKWSPDPLLGRTDLEDFEGWHGGSDWNASKTKIWTDNLPTKYLQHYQILSEQTGATTDTDTFTGGVVASGPAGATTTDQRVVTQDGVKVIDGTSYLIPWTDSVGDTTSPRLYHYNADGGQTTWTLTGDFKNAASFELYKLTDSGKVDEGAVTVNNGTVTLNADAGTAYVLYPTSTTPVTNAVQYGDGGPVADPGFNAGNLDVWHPTGDATATTYLSGQPVASFGTAASSVSQQLGKLNKGTYSASVELEIKPGYSRPTTLSVSGDGVVPVSNTIDRSTAADSLNSDTKHGTYAQRMSVTFTVAKNGAQPTLSIASVTAPDPAATVMLDDVRVVATQPSSVPAPKDGVVVVSEDFEHTPQGWGPFVKVGSSPDPKISITRKNGIYTQINVPGSLAANYDKTIDDVVDGNWSLRSHDPSGGTLFRTWDGTANLIPGHSYEFSMKYESAGAASVTVGHDSETAAPTSTTDQTFALDAASKPTDFDKTFTVDNAHSYVALSTHGADLSIDDVQIVDLTATPLSVSATVSPAQPDGNAGWYTTAPKMTLTATGGVDPYAATAGNHASSNTMIEYSVDGGSTWTTYTKPVSVPDGAETVQYRATLGQQDATGTIDVKSDASAPAIAFTVTQPDPTGAATVALSVSDATSGLGDAKYRVDGGSWTDLPAGAQSASASVVVANPGQHVVDVSASDVAGNHSDKSQQVTVASASGGSGGSGSGGTAGGGSGSLVNTGANVWPGLIAAIAIIVAGVAVLLFKRRTAKR